MTARALGLRVAIVASVLCAIAYCATLGHRPNGTRAIVLVCAAGIAWCGALWAVRRPPGAVDPDPNALRWIVAAILVSGLVAVTWPSRASDDVWSYAIYGRMVSAHGLDPYDHVPTDVREDPIFERVGPKWVSTPSRYGPLFSAVSAGITAVAGESPLRLRLGFQLLAAGGVAGVLALSWRRWRSAEALVVVGLHPLVVLSVVNGAHNDVFVALGVFAALLALERRRPVAAGLFVAVAALVKVSALFAVPAVVLWLWVRKERRSAVTFTLAGVVPALALSAAVPGCLDAIGSAREINHSSVWFLAQLFSTRPNTFPLHGPHWSQATLEAFVKTAALGVVAATIAAVAIVLTRRRTLPLAVAVAASLASFGVFGAWIVPWYFVWALPLVAAWRGPMRAFVGSWSLAFLVIVHVPLRVLHERTLTGWSWALCIVAPWVVAVSFVVAVVLEARGRGRSAPGVVQPSMPTGWPSII